MTLKEVAGDVISGQGASMVEVVPLTKFVDPSSNRLVTIHNGTDRQTDRRTDGQTDRAVTIAHPMLKSLQLLHRWAKNCININQQDTMIVSRSDLN